MPVYSNGFVVDEILPVFQQRIGWLQPTTAGMPVITGINTTSASGRYYNDDSFHVAATIEALYAVQNNPNITDTEFNDLLFRLDASVVMRCLNAVFNRPCLIEHKLLYTRTWNVLNVEIPNGGNFVGWRINIAPGDYAVQFDAISLYFNGAATFNLYMYNDLVSAPIHTKSVTTVANSQTRVALDSWASVNYINQTNLGGVIFIGYYQNDLPEGVMALDEQLNLYEKTTVFGGLPFQGAQVGEGSDRNFYRINPSINYRTYGLNLEVSSYRDYTQVILQNASLFDEARGLAMAITILALQKYSLRTNGTERITGEMLRDLNIETDLAFPTQEMPFVAGLKAQLVRAFKQLNENFWPKAKPQVASLMQGDRYADYLGMNIFDLPPRGNIV